MKWFEVFVKLLTAHFNKKEKERKGPICHSLWTSPELFLLEGKNKLS